MVRVLSVAISCVLAAVLLAGCANSAALKELKEKTEALDAAQTELRQNIEAAKKDLGDKVAASTAAASETRKELATLQQDLAKRDKAVDTRLDELVGRIEKVKTNLAQADKQLVAFSEQLKKMKSSIDQALALTTRNLELTRDLYKTQFVALEELLQNIKKAQEAAEKPAPATP